MTERKQKLRYILTKLHGTEKALNNTESDIEAYRIYIDFIKCLDNVESNMGGMGYDTATFLLNRTVDRYNSILWKHTTPFEFNCWKHERGSYSNELGMEV